MSFDLRKLTEGQKDTIEELSNYRFNHRISTRNIYDWLTNFKETEVDDALTFLSHVDYYTEDDIVSSLYCNIESYIKLKKRLHFVPIGEPGKSGHSMIYVIQGIMKSYKPKKAHYYSSIDALNGVKLTDKDIVFLVDDIIGSGKTFIDYYTAHPFLSTLFSSSAQTVLLAIIISEKGYVRLAKRYPKMQLLGEVKPDAFGHTGSCFGSQYKMLPYRELAFKYGMKLTGKKTEALGYDNSQQMVIFSHAIPNNSLPIFWSSAKGWRPLVPRFVLQRGWRALDERNEGNRWLVFFRDFFRVRADQLPNLFQDKTKYSLILVLRMKMKNVAEANIVNKLGLHLGEMEVLWKEGVKADLWDINHQPTDKCKKRFAELMKKSEILNSKNKHEASRAIDDAKYIYVPETFRSLK